MPKVVISSKGESQSVELRSGLRMIMAGMQAGLDQYGFGDCGGNLVCATCHVRVKSGTFPAMKLDEQYLLETLPVIYPDSRLACQLIVTEDCDVEWVG